MDLFSSLTLAADNPLDHVIDKPLYEVGGLWAISNVTVMLVLGSIILLFAMIAAAGRIRTGRSRNVDDFRTQGIWANFVEVICVYLRNEFKPILREYTDRFMPLLWTMFWFILVMNILGLVPLKDATAMFGINHGHGIGGTATQSIWVTGALAFISFLVINGVAIIKDPVGYVKHLTGGAPVYMWPIMVPVEILGTFVKPFALAMRLFANMTGGHMVVAVMLMFVKMMVERFAVVGGVMAVAPVIASIAIYFLEILVAFIQAFVFTYLTGLFLGQLIVHDHGDDHAHGHADHAHAH